MTSQEYLKDLTVNIADHSREFLMVALFLAKYGEKQPGNPYPKPPREVGTTVWKEAFLRFHRALGDGRPEVRFIRTLNRSRYTFDAHVLSEGLGLLHNSRSAILAP